MAALNLNYPYLTLGLLIACFAITLIITMRLQREVAEDSTPNTPGEVFDPLERAYRAGLMHEEEYLRIREKMARAHQEAGKAAAPGAEPQGAKKPSPRASEWASWDEPGL